jgi:tryptophan synthase alpha chain
MSRYDQMFAGLGGRGAFGGFVMLGDPTIEKSAAILDALVAGGADMIELGIPFSDPVADGPTIQGAAERALQGGATVAACFELLRDFRARHPDIPVGLLTYANIILAPGRDAFYAACARAGVDSVLAADVPAFEAEPFADAARRHGVEPVLIAAPNTPAATLQRIARLGGGYTYCVARAGVTGVETEMQLDHGALLAALKSLEAPPPVLGFGISTPAHVRSALDSGAAGVISGSAIVRLVEREPDPAAAVERFVRTMKAATEPESGAPASAPEGAGRLTLRYSS